MPKRELTGVMGIIGRFLAVVLPLYSIFQILGVGRFFNFYPDTGIYFSLFVGASMALTFLFVPASKKSSGGKLPFYDVALAALSMVGPVYMAFFYNQFQAKHGVGYTGLELVLGFITVVLLLEATRRVIGWPMVGVALAFIFHAYFSNYCPGMFRSRGYPVDRLIGAFFVTRDGAFGLPTDIAASLIIVFMLFGEFLNLSGAGDWFTNLAMSLVGHVRGGPAKVAVVASSLLGTITGSATANAATVGIITIPMMKKAGYKDYFAGAVESVSSTGGQIMPPVMGVTAFLLAEFVGIPYGSVAIAAAIPAVLYYLAVFLQVDFEAAQLGLRGLPREQLPPINKTFLQGWYYLLPLAVLVYFLIVLRFSPATSAFYALACLLLVSLLKKETRPTLKKVVSALENTSKVMLMVAISCATSGIIIAALNLTGLGINFSQFLISSSGGNLFVLLLITAIACAILGMGLPILAAYIMLAILIGPALANLGIWALAAHLFIFYYAVMSFITPPVAPAVYVCMGIAKSSLWPTGLQAMRLGIVAYIVPFAFIYRPALLLHDSLIEIVIATVAAVIGVIALSAGVEGYMLKPTRWWERVLLAAAGIALFTPWLLINIIATAASAFVFLIQKRNPTKTHLG